MIPRSFFNHPPTATPCRSSAKATDLKVGRSRSPIRTVSREGIFVPKRNNVADLSVGDRNPTSRHGAVCPNTPGVTQQAVTMHATADMHNIRVEATILITHFYRFEALANAIETV
jgi:hypothetical protein